ncbi:hypothetical protein [Pontibacter sp. SGAir0037]|uniref:hypothetical protein n=1 Tax=Pontibacter sp. SGAir0037 TaxID=2571030 RepID=UPI0010CCD50D|nr:hypothetical protein [Pontibacter sp. SGAir0037]QCR23757.1 hypothetical protein C1N53_16325 [Pontibacter sp. SGAir0037]
MIEEQRLMAFIAHNFYEQDCEERNEYTSRWQALTPELQAQYLERAAEAFREWDAHENHTTSHRLQRKIDERKRSERRL